MENTNDIQYKLIATVDDEVVYEHKFPDTVLLEESLAKAENAVSEKIEEIYS